MEEELEVSLVDLLYYVLRRWRRLLVWALVMLIVLDLGAGYRDYSNQSAEYEARVQELSTEEEDYSDTLAELTDEQIRTTDEMFELYQDYQKTYEEMEEYYDNSILMHVDTNAVPRLTLRYYVDNHFEVSYPTISKYNNISDIINSYTQALYRNEVYSAMAEAIGRTESASFLEECLTTDTSGGTGAMRITITGASEKEARAMGKVIEKQIGEETEKLQAVYGSFDLTKVGEDYRETVSSDLRSQQQSMVSALQGLQSTMLTTKSSLSEEQLVYFEQRVANESSSRETVSVAEPEESTETGEAELQSAPSQAKFRWINVKYMLLGLLVGLFLGCVYYAMVYLLSSKLRSVNDVSLGYRLHVFGTYRQVTDSNRKRFGGALDEGLEHMFRKDTYVLGEEENVKRICTEMEIAIAKNGSKRVHLTGSADSEEVCALIGKLQKKLSAGGVQVTCGKSVIFDTESLEALTSADAVILVEQVAKSKYSHLEGELNICKQYQLPVMGVVVLE